MPSCAANKTWRSRRAPSPGAFARVLRRESEAEERAKLELANDYYGRFDNVFTGPGIVENGAIRPLPLKQTMEEFSSRSSSARRRKWSTGSAYITMLGVNEIIMNLNIGHSNDEAMECMERSPRR